MKAAVCRAFGEALTIEEVTLGAPEVGEIEVRVHACAICHSDLAFADGAWGGELPAVYGHEAAGVVEAVGPGVRRLRPGDHVVATLIRACGHCPSCAAGRPVTCEGEFARDRQSPLLDQGGHALVQGLRTAAFAERIVIDESQAVAIPADLPLDAACLLACAVITGVGAVVNTARMPLGASAVVIGAGGVGLNSIQGAALAGARRIVALDVNEGKLEAALRFGASDALDGRAADVVERVRALTGGRGADYVFVTVGARAALQQAFDLASPSGAIVLVGMPPTGVTVELEPGRLADRNQRLLGSKMGGARILADIPKLVSLYRAGRLELDGLISNRYPLDAINEAIAEAKRGEVLRNVILM